MKGYIIMSMSIDGPTADDDGVFSASNFGLCSTLVHKSKEESKETCRKVVEADLESLKGSFDDEEYSYEIEEDGNITFSVYAEDGELLNTTIYKIEEVEF